ncbi:MAG: helix-turn-helix domain-containing protein [Candidatus Dormibacteria bacterium]
MRSRSVRLESEADPTGRIMIFPHGRVADSDRDVRSVLLEIRLVDPGQTTPPPAPADERRPRLLRVEEAAKMLALSRAVLYPMLGRELPVVRIGRMVRVPLEAVETFIREHSE